MHTEGYKYGDMLDDICAAYTLFRALHQYRTPTFIFNLQPGSVDTAPSKNFNRITRKWTPTGTLL